MPFGCGTWPALWMLGPDWPNYGEIDIVEGVNIHTTNSLTLHSNSGCLMNVSRLMTGEAATYNCDAAVNGNSVFYILILNF